MALNAEKVESKRKNHRIDKNVHAAFISQLNQ